MKPLFSIFLLLSFTSIHSQQLLIPRDEGSKIHFVTKNFGIKTGGDINGLKGNIKLNPKNPATSMFDVTVDVSTIDTDNSSRDKHLRSDDYFDVVKYPVIRLTSTSIEKTTDAATWLFSGKLTIKSITKSISFPFTIVPSNGGYLFTGGFQIDRRDFNVGGNSATLSDDVVVSLSVFAK
ncbi:MAG TPA: YceI family protein [Ferruginibacter sp.]|nr:YceI family protein [Ferruginibacter sp.]